METQKGTYVARRTVYSFFLAAFAIIFFIMIYWASFEQSLKIGDPMMGVKGSKAELKIEIRNESNHAIRDIQVFVKTNDNASPNKQLVQSFPVPDLNAGETAAFSQELEIPDNLSYVVEVRAPFNRTISIPFTLDDVTVNPVSIEVGLSENGPDDWQMSVGKEYSLTKKICNRARDALSSVGWEESINGNYFEEPMFPTAFSLEILQCKSFVSRLTPTTPGMATFKFKVIVGELRKEIEKQVQIVSK
ncbi:MAG: hypothetical protein NTZ73_02945 [Candidatus Diapherotrites archaeon]|nr:hypothetical protein [Candidatus Diapherotrites archaeon]